ncbi:MAG: Brp/Blh family beta-carotene 15,15'-dioxygenase [Actinobacteria bacterium]|nr:Brp/Blh family beta-carotene 15,15'-dioxygenase [Actinomycetota bacterium]
MTTLRRTWTLPTYLGLGAAAVLGLLAPALVTRFEWVPLLLSLPLLGMAHGAVDHHVPGRLLRRVLTRRERVLLIAAYSGLSIVLMGLWWLAPLVALALFLLIAIIHWGDGDLWFCEVINGRSAPRSFMSLLCFILARGLVPIAVPILIDAKSALPAFDGLLKLFGRDDTLTITETQRLIGLLIVGAVVVAAALLSVRDNRTRPRSALLIDLGELALLSAFFLLTPAVFAVGMYFLLWHSPRHILRLMASEPHQRALLDTGRSLAALVAFHREALLFTVVPLIGVAAIAVALAATGAAQIAAVSLAVIASLTYPHAAIVAWMDHRQGVWRTSD